MNFSLKKSIWITIFPVALFFVLLLLLSLRQSQLFNRYEEIASESESMLFEFSLFREHINESLINKGDILIGPATKEAEEVNTRYLRLLESPYIPEEIKITILGQVDLLNIVLLLKKIESGVEKKESLQEINREVRRTGDRMIKFDRVIVSHAKAQLVAFQKIVIGILALVVFLISALLIFWYRLLVTPLLMLTDKVRELSSSGGGQLPSVAGCREINDLSSSLNAVIARKQEEKEKGELFAIRSCGLAAVGRIAAGMAHEINNLINGIINFAQLLLDKEQQTEKEDSKATLDRIIKESERISVILQEVLFLVDKKDGGRVPAGMKNVVTGALSLLERQLMSDGIKVDLDIAEDLPPVDINVRNMQLVCVNLLNNARSALNQRFPFADEDKRIEIKGVLLREREKQRVRLTFIDHGAGADLQKPEEDFGSESSDGIGVGLGISRMLVEKYGGSFSFSAKSGAYSAVTITFNACS